MDATDARIAAANRRKLLAQREQLFNRQQQKLKREVQHRELAYRRKEVAKVGDDPITSRLYYSAAGSGSSWRAREHVNLKNSPQNSRRKSTWSDNDDDEIEEIERLMKLTRKLHEEEEKDKELSASMRRGNHNNSSNNNNQDDPQISARSQEREREVEELTKSLEMASSFKIEKKKKKEIKPISSGLYERLSFQKLKQSRAEADELMY